MPNVFEKTLSAVGWGPEEIEKLRAAEAAKLATPEAKEKMSQQKWLQNPENKAWADDLFARQQKNAELQSRMAALEQSAASKAERMGANPILKEAREGVSAVSKYVPDEVVKDIDLGAYRKAMEMEAKQGALSRLGGKAISTAGKVGHVAGKLLGPAAAIYDFLDPVNTQTEEHEEAELKKYRGR